MQPLMHDLVQDMRSFLLSHAPGGHDTMLHFRACSTFATVYHAVKDATTAGHLAGTSTLAMLLIGPADVAGHVATDRDPDDEVAHWHWSQSGAKYGSTSFASIRRRHHHDGGSVWVRQQEVH